MESSDDAIDSTTTDGIILTWNPAAERLYGWRADEVKGKHISIIVPPERSGELHRFFEMIKRGEKIEHYETVRLRKDGTTVDVSLTISPIRDIAGKTVAISAISRDITDRKQAEQRRRELEEHKREFYRRTVLAATGGKLDICERSEIKKVAGPAVASWTVKHPGKIGVVRHEVARLLQSAGMDKTRINDFVLCLGEATTNALKHAGEGQVSLHRTAGRMMFVVSDRGPGIEALTLPEVALTRGYSTTGSLGMGYKAMICLADIVYLETGPAGTTVAVQMAIKSPILPTLVEMLPDTW
ncbi:MAG: PAS domain S-box protein [Armatimonadetes bacterium]|nr:PAS domain S-box protein [Armatimonadota bacterium]